MFKSKQTRFKELQEMLKELGVITNQDFTTSTVFRLSTVGRVLDNLQERENLLFKNTRELQKEVEDLKLELRMIKQLLNIEEVEEMPKGLRKESKVVYFEEGKDGGGNSGTQTVMTTIPKPSGSGNTSLKRGGNNGNILYR